MKTNNGRITWLFKTHPYLTNYRLSLSTKIFVNWSLPIACVLLWRWSHNFINIFLVWFAERWKNNFYWTDHASCWCGSNARADILFRIIPLSSMLDEHRWGVTAVGLRFQVWSEKYQQIWSWWNPLLGGWRTNTSIQSNHSRKGWSQFDHRSENNIISRRMNWGAQTKTNH